MAGLLPAICHAQVTFLNSWNTVGPGNQLEEPNGVAVSAGGDVYVADSEAQRVDIFTSSGTFVSSLATGPGSGYITSYPVGVAVGANGNVYVGDYVAQHVDVFSSSGAQLSNIGSGADFYGPQGVALDASGNLYVVDNGGSNRVDVFNSSGTFQSSFGNTSTGPVQLDNPNYVAVSGSGNVYVTNSANNSVDIFSTSGAFLSGFGSLNAAGGSGAGQFINPQGVAVSASGNVYVADSGNSRVEIFNSAGIYESSFGTPGNNYGDFTSPQGVAVSANGNVYVADSYNDEISRFFDPSAWISGTNTFTNSTIGPTTVNVGAGQILGTSLTLNSSMGLVVGNTLNVYSGGSLTQNGGSLSASDLNVSSGGSFVYQGGSFSVNEMFPANGVFQATTGGHLSLPGGFVTGYFADVVLDGGTSLSCGAISMQGGLLALGDATVTNTGSNPSYLYSGEIQLQNQNLSIVNTSQLFNEGGLIDGSGRINGQLENYSSGQVSVASGQTMTVLGFGNTNNGLFSLSGGTLHFTADLTNETGGQIDGYGTLRADGGLSNLGNLSLGGSQAVNLLGSISNSGQFSLAGSAYIFGNLTNNAGGTIHLSGNQPNIFYGAVSNGGTLTIDSGASGLFYGGYSGNTVVNNAGTLAVEAASVSGQIVGNGSLTVGNASQATTLQLISGSGATSESALTINTGSKLDLTNNDLIVHNGSLSQIQSLVDRGYANGAEDGSGIISSTASANDRTLGVLLNNNGSGGPIYTSFDGQSVSSTDVLVKYTLYGDANLDGTVNFTDLLIVAQNYGKSGTDWAEGDFNDDGSTGFADLLLLAQNYNQSLTSAQASQLDAMSPSFVGAWSLAQSEVPEPASLGAIVFLGSALRRGRRRRYAATAVPV